MGRLVATGTVCEGGKCVPVLPLGASCARDGVCSSGHCLDAHCCADTKGCAPYICASGSGCTTQCTDSSGCAKGFVCQSNACVPDAATAVCSEDLSESIPKSGPRQVCAPYRCDPSSGACRTTCAKTDDCATGSVCDPDRKLCVASAAESDDGGGCMLGVGTSDSLAMKLGLALAACAIVLAHVRRKR